MADDQDSREVRLGARRPADPHSKFPWGNGSVTRIFGDATLLEDRGAPTTTPWPKFSRPGTCGSVVWVGCATPDSSFWRHPTGGTSGGTEFALPGVLVFGYVGGVRTPLFIFLATPDVGRLAGNFAARGDFAAEVCLGSRARSKIFGVGVVVGAPLSSS